MVSAPVRYRRTFLASLLAVTTGLAVATSVVAGRPAAADQSSVAGIDWEECPKQSTLDCGTLTVPLDHDRPDGATIELALQRRKADDQSRKIGTLLANPGGPGTRGRPFARYAEHIFGPAVVERFDVVGFDPRGIGRSAPIQCFDSDAERERLLGSIEEVPITHGEVKDWQRAAKKYGKACKHDAGPLLGHMSTLNVAKDLDRLRSALGEERLTYVGYSYGSLIGVTYANLYPQRVRAMVLDGPVDAAKRTNHRMDNKFDRAAGFETALSGMLAACEAAGAKCALAEGAKEGASPREKVDQLRARLRRGPIRISETTSVTLSTFTTAVGGALYRIDDFESITRELQTLYEYEFGYSVRSAVHSGRVSMLASGEAGPLRDRKFGGNSTRERYSYNFVDAFFAVNCVDAPVLRKPQWYVDVAERFEANHPTFGRMEAFSELPCATWPVETRERYSGPWDARTPPLLVIGTTHDPATPYSMARRLTASIGNARLLTVDGFGHISQASACAKSATARYLLRRELPEPGARCAQDVAPFR